jgi:DNA-damage-inducible protein J
MPNTATINARIDPAIKKQVTEILNSLGITTSQAISLFFKQIIYKRGIPFEIRIPSPQSMETIAKVEAEEGLHEVSDADELLKELKS